MEITRGSRDVLTEGTIREILESVKSKFQREQINQASKHQAELQREADARTEELSNQLREEQQKKDELLEAQRSLAENRRKKAQHWARKLFWILRFCLLSVNFLFLLASSPIHVLSIDLNKISLTGQFLLGCLWITVSLAVLLELRDGRNLRARVDDAELRFARWIERKLMSL